MKFSAASLAVMAALVATPALAHSGNHLHPHGAGNWLAICLSLVAVGVAGVVAVSHFRGRK